MRRPMLGAVLTAIAVSLTLTGSAMARAGDRTLAGTYPAATALCLSAHARALPPKLEGKRGELIAACDTLENAFAPLVSTVDTAEASYLNTVAAQKALVAAACPRPVVDKTGCQDARGTARSTDSAALQTRRNAVTAFRTAIEANRTTFWTAIQSLRSAP